MKGKAVRSGNRNRIRFVPRSELAIDIEELRQQVILDEKREIERLRKLGVIRDDAAQW